MKKIAVRAIALAAVAAGLSVAVAPAADAGTSWPPHKASHGHGAHHVARDTQWGG